jgi:cytochrome oxidase assembly protein ShyY1
MREAAPAFRPVPRKSARSHILLTILALGALAILIALGTWQLQRRAWKNDLVARFSFALSKPPAPYEPPAQGATEAAREFMRVSAEGEFLDAQTVKVLVPAPELLRAETGDAFGYLLFTPLKTGGATVFVNRGFAPRKIADEGGAKAGAASVTGIVRLSQKPGLFTPAPDLGRSCVTNQGRNPSPQPSPYGRGSPAAAVEPAFPLQPHPLADAVTLSGELAKASSLGEGQGEGRFARRIGETCVTTRLFFAADIPAMAKAAGVADAVPGEYIEAEPALGAQGWPRPRDPRELLASIPNRHLEYALTWFGLAAALACVYGCVIARS